MGSERLIKDSKGDRKQQEQRSMFVKPKKNPSTGGLRGTRIPKRRGWRPGKKEREKLSWNQQHDDAKTSTSDLYFWLFQFVMSTTTKV